MNIDTYIANSPQKAQPYLRYIRQEILMLIPKIEEKIRYDMPAFVLGNQVIIYVAAWKDYLSIYPAPRKSQELVRKLAPYYHAKGTLRIPYADPFPYLLLREVIEQLFIERQV